MKSLSGVAALGAVWLIAVPVRANPDDIVGRPLVLASGAIDVQLSAAINVQTQSFWRPLSLAPDAWWGATSHLTIGIIHSDTSIDQISTSGSFCVREVEFSTCEHFYHGGGVDARYSAFEGSIGGIGGELGIAPRVRVLIRELDPFKPAMTLGALVRWTRSRFAIASDPYLRLPLANRDLGNRAQLMLPLSFIAQPAAAWALALRTGFYSDLIVIHDGYHIPLSLGVTSRLTDEIDLGLEAGWADLIGPQRDARHATIIAAVSWHEWH